MDGVTIPRVAGLTGELGRNPNLTRIMRRRMRGQGVAVAIVGDSTSTLTINAQAMATELAFFQAGGEALNGYTLLDFGNSGASLATWLAGGGTTGHTLADLIAAAPDLIVFSFGINDVRLGATTEDALYALHAQAMDRLRQALPGAEIVLRMPNSLLSDDPGSTGYVSPLASAQTYTDILRNAYYRLAYQYPNAVLLDTQRAIFGTAALPAASNPWMQDVLHPSTLGYQYLARALAALIGYKEPFSSTQAARARAVSYGADYSQYYRAVEDAGYYDLIATGRYIGQGSGFIDFSWPGTRASEINDLDILVVGDQAPWQLPVGTGKSATGANTRLNQLGSGNPPVSIAKGTVSVYRHKYMGSATIETYWKQYYTYPYRWRGVVTEAGAGFIRISALTGEITGANRTATLSSDTFVAEDGTVATSFTNNAVSGNKRQLNHASFTSALLNKRCVIFGNHAYENGSLFRATSAELPQVQVN